MAARLFPAHTDHGRRTKGTSEFTMKIDRRNLGCCCAASSLFIPNQRAEVYVGRYPKTTMEACRCLVSGRLEYLRVFESTEGIGRNAAHRANSNRRFRERRISDPARSDRGSPRHSHSHLSSRRSTVRFFPGYPCRNSPGAKFATLPYSFRTAVSACQVPIVKFLFDRRPGSL